MTCIHNQLPIAVKTHLGKNSNPHSALRYKRAQTDLYAGNSLVFKFVVVLNATVLCTKTVIHRCSRLATSDHFAWHFVL